MSNVFDDETRKNKNADIQKDDAAEKALVKAEEKKVKDLADKKKIEDKADTDKDVEKAKLKAEVRAEIEAEVAEALNKSSEERDALIKKIQKSDKKSAEEKEVLKRLLMERAKENAKKSRELGKLMPSQMTIPEMLQYCDEKGITYEKGDSTVFLRARIAAFRNPAKADRLVMLKNKPFFGKTI